MSKKEQSAKMKALELTLGKLEKTYGKGVVMKLGDKVVEDIASIPTGSINLDLALGVFIGICNLDSLLRRQMDDSYMKRIKELEET